MEAATRVTDRARLWLQSVAAVIWSRRWKILFAVFVWSCARSCEYLPELAQPVCEFMVNLLRKVPV